MTKLIDDMQLQPCLQKRVDNKCRSLTPNHSNNKISHMNTENNNKFVGTSCCNHPSSLNEEGIDSQIGTLESTDGHCTYTTGGASAFVASRNGTACMRTMFYTHYETI